MADPGRLGGKLGPRLATHLHRAATRHLLDTAHTRANIAAQGTLKVFRTITAETRTTVGPLFRELADHPDQPAYLRDTLRFLAHGSGELQAVVSALTTAQSLTPGIGQLLSNDLGPKIQNLLAENPHALLSPADAARAVALGLWGDDHGTIESARSGLSQNRYETLVELARAFPDPETALELLRRGEVSRDLVAEWMRRNGFGPDTVNHLLALERQHIPPAMAAEMLLRGIIDETKGREIARVWGFTPGDFDAMATNVGEPPAVQELLFLWRRGKIDRARLEHGIRQSRVRNEWIDAVENLRYVPMDTASAVAAVVQNQLPHDRGAQVAQENGLEPDHFEVLVNTHGRPPGIEQMAELFNRGEISRARFEQAIRESDIKNKYIDDLVKIRRRLMPERTVVSAITKGVLTHKQGVDHLLQLGFNAADATTLASEASATKTEKHKELAWGTILQLYEAGTIERTQAHDAIAALGYTKEETAWILDFAEVRRDHAEQQHAIGVVRARFVAWHIDQNAAQGMLHALQLPAATVSRYLRLWSLERDASPRMLTEAQVIKALKKGAIDQPTAIARHVAMGYSQADAELLVTINT